jgi:ketosteroid isomerase-like protein
VTDSLNVELARSIYADWERGEFSGVDWASPSIEYTLGGVSAFPTQTWRGLSGLAEAARSVIQAFEKWSIRATEYRDLDNRRVLVLDRRSGQGKRSGLPFDQHAAHLFEIHSGKVTRLVAYADRDRAFADLGLAEERDALA